jgi:hypothetical protein
MSQGLPVVRYLILCEDVQIAPDNPHRVTLVDLISAIQGLELPPFPLVFRTRANPAAPERPARGRGATFRIRN